MEKDIHGTTIKTLLLKIIFMSGPRFIFEKYRVTMKRRRDKVNETKAIFCSLSARLDITTTHKPSNPTATNSVDTRGILIIKLRFKFLATLAD